MAFRLHNVFVFFLFRQAVEASAPKYLRPALLPRDGLHDPTPLATVAHL